MKLINRTVALCSLVLITACSQKDSANSALMNEFESKVGNKVFFALDSSAISAEASQTLAAQAGFMKNHSDKDFIIEGHCDERGTREYNLALGERRANAALKALAKHGVAPEKMTVISFGKEKPMVEGNDQAAWAKNRRAVTIIQ